MITPKEKAEELVLKLGKDHAIIAVQEILESKPTEPSLEDEDIWDNQMESTIFWQEVLEHLKLWNNKYTHS